MCTLSVNQLAYTEYYNYIHNKFSLAVTFKLLNGNRISHIITNSMDVNMVKEHACVMLQVYI